MITNRKKGKKRDYYFLSGNNFTVPYGNPFFLPFKRFCETKAK